MTALTAQELQKVLDHAGSWKRFKEMLGINEKECGSLIRNHQLSLRKLSTRHPEEIAQDLKRIGSVSLFSIIYGCKPSELHNVLTVSGIQVKGLVSPVGSTSGIGRKGELFFKEVRGEAIIEDCFETRGHTNEFDFIDRDYGPVNVKTASRQRYTARTRSANPSYWHFSTKGHRDCDYLAFIPLGPSGDPSIVIIAQSVEIGDYFPKHLVLTGNDIKQTSSAMTNIEGPLFRMMVSRLDRKPTIEQPEEMQSMRQEIETEHIPT